MSHPNRFLLAKRQAEAGLSLIELMISLAIGLLLMVIILQIFLGSKDTYRSLDNHSRLQENGRYILEEMSRDLRMSGYLGCSNNAKINQMVKSSADSWLLFNDPVHGYEAAGGATGLTVAEVKSGTDIMRTQRASAADANVTDNLVASNANIKIDSNPEGFVDGETLIISDCANADIFCASNVAGGSGETTITHAASCNDATAPKLSKLYGPHSQLMRLSTNIYYVGTGVGGCEANALCRKVLSGSTLVVEQLIENVESMKIQYGEDTDSSEDCTDRDSTANRFVSASSVGNWNKIVSVRLNLLLRSNDSNLTIVPQPYTFNGGASVTPIDRRMRRVFSSTVTLRNCTP